MTECSVCGNQIPEGEYCGACGAHLPTSSAHRAGAFAADPGQHVLHPNVVSTLFPHLPHRQSTHFRLGLLGLGIILVALGVLRLTGPEIAVAAASVPVLYVLYLYEVEIYEEQPLLVIALTFGLGLVLGAPWAILTGPIVTHALLAHLTNNTTTASLLAVGVVIPLGAQVLMLAGALVLYRLGRYREPLDGFTFGAAGALGFALATTLVNLAPELQRGLVGGAPATTNALVVLARGLLVPFLDASTTGLLAGALWLRRVPTRRLPFSWLASLPAAIAVAAIVRIILGISAITVLRTGVVVLSYLITAAALLLWVRLALHRLLLAHREDVVIGPAQVCCNCHHVVPRMRFCPHCGIATAATPRTGRRLPPIETPVLEEGAGGGMYRTASRDEIESLAPGPGRPRRWSAAAGAMLAGALALAAVAVLLTPSRRAACGIVCAPPPPPCLTSCPRATAAPPLRTDQTYTSGAYGYSVDYTQFSPSHTDNSSVGWDLSSNTGQYSVEVTAAPANGSGPQKIIGDLIGNNFPDYSLLYDIPGAEVGYTPGAGSVYDDEVTPLLGQASDTRLAVLVAVKNGLAIAVIGSGDAANGAGSFPDPSGLPISGFVDSLTDATRWPGQPPR